MRRSKRKRTTSNSDLPRYKLQGGVQNPGELYAIQGGSEPLLEPLWNYSVSGKRTKRSKRSTKGTSKSRTKAKKWYYGYAKTERGVLITVFSTATEPTQKSHGKIYFAINGPYSSKKLAIAKAKEYRRGVNHLVKIQVIGHGEEIVEV